MADWHAASPRRDRQQAARREAAQLQYLVLHLATAGEDEKAVETLMRRHKLQGTIEDWLPAYQAELQAVLSKRCRRIEGEEYTRVMKTEKVVKLRMNPEPKKNGRKKMRLLLKGFMEPHEWTGKSDSPTVLASTVKMLVAMSSDLGLGVDLRRFNERFGCPREIKSFSKIWGRFGQKK